MFCASCILWMIHLLMPVICNAVVKSDWDKSKEDPFFLICRWKKWPDPVKCFSQTKQDRGTSVTWASKDHWIRKYNLWLFLPRLDERLSVLLVLLWFMCSAEKLDIWFFIIYHFSDEKVGGTYGTYSCISIMHQLTFVLLCLRMLLPLVFLSFVGSPRGLF